MERPTRYEVAVGERLAANEINAEINWLRHLVQSGAVGTISADTVLDVLQAKVDRISDAAGSVLLAESGSTEVTR